MPILWGRMFQNGQSQKVGPKRWKVVVCACLIQTPSESWDNSHNVKFIICLCMNQSISQSVICVPTYHLFAHLLLVRFLCRALYLSFQPQSSVCHLFTHLASICLSTFRFCVFGEPWLVQVSEFPKWKGGELIIKPCLLAFEFLAFYVIALASIVLTGLQCTLGSTAVLS